MSGKSAAAAGGPTVLSEFPITANGFNTIRLIAALAVIVSHAFPLNGQAEPLKAFTDHATIGGLSVNIFFLVSGFLIPASLLRGSLLRYAEKRARRIMPALIVAVLLCALVLGPMVTTVPLGAYFSNSDTLKFLGHAAFLPVGFDLPGVFEGNPDSSVNGSLWSLKFEVACYIAVPILMALAPFRKAAVWSATIASFVLGRLVAPEDGGLAFYIGTMAELFQFYGMGMLFFLYRDVITIRASFGWIALAIAALAAFTPFFVEAVAVFGSYAVITFAYLCPKGFRDITAKGDISYGVYVYAFPVQQLLVPATIGFTLGSASAGWLANTLLTMPIVAVLGGLSWILIEKPALSWRTKPKAPVKAA